MNPVATLILVFLALVVLIGSKRSALLALAGGVLYLSEYSGLDVLGLNLFSFRFLEIAVFLRVIARGEITLLRLNGIDRAFLAFYAYTTVVFLLRSNEALAFQIGATGDACIVYFSCRALIDSPDDFRWFLRSFVLLLIPFVLLVISEALTNGRSLGFIGWRSPGGFGHDLRHGRIRCDGSFRHPSLLGTVSVSFIPMLIGLAFDPGERKRMYLGVVLCLVILWAANSGGPISGVAFGCFAWCFWRYRTKMRSVRWGIAGILLLAVIFMKAPIWYLPDRVSALSGGDGWHRSYLMNVAFESLGKWWLAGMPMSETANWFPYMVIGAEAADITNQYLIYGLSAGIGAIALFILVLTRAFGGLGAALQTVRAASRQTGKDEFLLWGMGCMLAAHVVNWFGISYFDQTWAFWFLQLAAISSLSDWYVKAPSNAFTEIVTENTGLELQGSEEVAAQ